MGVIFVGKKRGDMGGGGDTCILMPKNLYQKGPTGYF